MTATPLPASLQYGKVIGRVVLAGVDSTDTGELPDGLGVSGTARFVRMNGTGQVVDGVFVHFPVFTAPINDSGELETRPGQPGLWLPVGSWTARVTLDNGASISDSFFEVLPSHTAESPLNMFASTPPTGPVLEPSEYSALDMRVAELEEGGDGAPDVIDGGVP
jgi:hypothetical protein